MANATPSKGDDQKATREKSDPKKSAQQELDQASKRLDKATTKLASATDAQAEAQAEYAEALSLVQFRQQNPYLATTEPREISNPAFPSTGIPAAGEVVPPSPSA